MINESMINGAMADKSMASENIARKIIVTEAVANEAVASKSMATKSIVWFRQDLRLSDNPALYEAARCGSIIPVYIIDPDENLGAMSKLAIDRALRVFNCLDNSPWSDKELCSGKAPKRRGGSSSGLQDNSALNSSISDNFIPDNFIPDNSIPDNFRISVYHGNSLEIFRKLVDANQPDKVFWNRCYEPWRIKSDKEIMEFLDSREITCKTFNGSLLWEPSEILKDDGTPYRVYTPFYRKSCLSKAEPRMPLPVPETMILSENKLPYTDAIQPHPKWHQKITWEAGEKAAQTRLQEFLTSEIQNYKQGRNFPGLAHVSRLSPYLHFGMISPNQVWHKAKATNNIIHSIINNTQDTASNIQDIPAEDLDHFLSELGWREFSYYLLYHFPDLPEKNFQPKFDKFPWRSAPDLLRLWQKGKTGYPIVDAGMRELWATGYMHNRVRMIVASFLIKNLLIHWHYGRDWFWDCLLDADLANNSASWQWVAGSGADAAPYFRIFNPVLQGKKFDPDGEYIKKHVPELEHLPIQYLYEPWTAPEEILIQSKVSLGTDYPYPIVELDTSRDAALESYKSLNIDA